jgi:hypothetical protein
VFISPGETELQRIPLVADSSAMLRES